MQNPGQDAAAEPGFLTVAPEDFDVASRPGLREQLDDTYRKFRAVQAASQGGLEDESALSPRGRCPSCEAPVGRAQVLFVKNGIVHGRCTSCDLVYTTSTLDEENDAAQYEATEFMRAYAELKLNPLYTNLDRMKAAYYLQEALPLTGSTEAAVLDIGASTGSVMNAATALGLAAFGIEPDTTVTASLGENFPDRFVTGFFPQDLPPDWPRFDIITLLDVLEHVREPVEFLRQIAPHLSSRGVLAVQVPNHQSLFIQLQGMANSNYCVGHWQHFTAQTLEGVVRRAGYELIRVSTVISELDRIRAFADDEIAAATARLTGKAVIPASPHELWSLGLGYKLFALLRVAGPPR